MKRPIIILIIAMVAGLVSYSITRTQHTAPAGTLLDDLPELAWLRKELDLTDGQFAKIADLHAAYRPVCAEMCQRIGESRARLESVALKNRVTGTEVQQAIADYERVRSECKSKMLEHLYQTAAMMSEEQAERYLKTVLPSALGSTGAAHSHH